MKNIAHRLAQTAAAMAASTLCLSVSAQAPAAGTVDQTLYANARPGECFARVLQPARFESRTERVLKRAATSRIEVIPARFEADEEEVVVREASKRLVVIPATYKTVEEEIEVRPASKRVEVVPAVYEEQSERVLVQAAHTVWKRGSAYLGQARATRTVLGANDDEILCLVEVPAEYRTVTRRIEKSPATTREVTIPAVMKTVQRTVVDQPAFTQEIELPAVSRKVKVTRLVEEAKERRIDIPEEWATISSTHQVSDQRWEWRRILCETNATQAKIKEIQLALRKAGFEPGPIDGVIKSQTMSAVNAFQKARNLPVDDYLNIETVNALGVKTL